MDNFIVFDTVVLNTTNFLMTSDATSMTSSTTTVWQTVRTVIVAVLLGSFMLSAVVGNVLVIVSVLRYHRLRIRANSFIVSLAFADLLVALLVMPFSASQVRDLVYSLRG